MQRSCPLFGDQGMPVIDEFMDIPVLDWCPAFDAVLWIIFKRPPVALDHAVSLDGDDNSLTLGFYGDGKHVKDNPKYFSSWFKLYQVASQGKVGLRGRPAIGLQKIVFGLLGPFLLCEKWGDFEEISPEKLKTAGSYAFSYVERSNFLNDGIIYPTEYYPKTAWAYGSIEVNFRPK
jgi:hypothetical protein